MGRAKVRLAIQDVLRGERVGILKLRYDSVKDTVVLEHVKADTVRIGKRGKMFEEPDYIGQTLERSVADLIAMFPDKEDKIKKSMTIYAFCWKKNSSFRTSNEINLL